MVAHCMPTDVQKYMEDQCMVSQVLSATCTVPSLEGQAMSLTAIMIYVMFTFLKQI